MIRPEDESARPAEGAGFGDAVTFAFGDPRNDLYGSARLGLVPGEQVHASGLGLLFHDGELVATDAAGGVELDAADWTRLEVGDVTAEIVEPLRSWRVEYDGEGGGFTLRFDAIGEPAEIGSGEVAKSAAGLRGYEQLCHVSGEVRVGDRRWDVECLGQRGHQWGAPDWDKLELARTVALWFEGEQGIALAAVRPTGANGHDAELLSAYLLDDQETTPVWDPRVSTVVDGEGRQRRAGLELWVREDGEEGPLRIAGEAVCGTTIELGRLRLDSAFFAWRMSGRDGVGRYDVLRRV